ncbi:7544_t:CDS:1 [Racocetra fulgida]|uniref:7544_t:CDS:1 n=1 Tax=Racocetra fulgida TaxID=60492 RepID=A0A9N8VKE9_9GLOM|nr:7544_t:CDS:1 [Racocetra fulgida]
MASKRIIYIFLYFLLLALSCIITEAKKKVKAEGANVPLAGPTTTTDNALESAPPAAINGPVENVENGNDATVTPGYTPVPSVSSTADDANPNSQITDTPAGLPANVDAPVTQSQTSASLSQTLPNQPTTSPQPAQLNASQPALPNQVDQAQPTSQPTLHSTTQASQSTVQPAPPASKPTEPPKSNQKNNDKNSDNTDSNDSDDVEADDNNPQQTTVYAVAPGKQATQLDSTSGASTVIMTRKSDYYSGIMAALSMVVIGSVLMI